MLKNIKKEKGITMVSLVITIIVLLILAGISINAVIGNNGILNKATSAKSATEKVDEKEQLQIILNDYSANELKINKTLVEYLNDKITKKEIKEVKETTDELIVKVNNYEFKVDTNRYEVIEE